MKKLLLLISILLISFAHSASVELDPRRKILTHGEAAVAMITGILFQVMQLYRICKFAAEKNVLNVLLPAIAPEEYFDDRLADTLDAIFDYGYRGPWNWRSPGI